MSDEQLRSCATAAFFAGAALLIAGDGAANDGRDRYQQGYPNLFHHLAGPVSPGAGFRVLAADKEGGADGDPAFRWAQSHALAVVEIAARHTIQALGHAAHDMAVFDLSAENGDTPIGFPSRTGEDKPAPPRGRHPGGSHDGGLNLDLGYYLTSLKGRTVEEDYAACSDHHATVGEGETGTNAERSNRKDVHEAGPEDVNMCRGPADRLDVERQSFFLLELLKLHRDRFEGRLLDEIGADEKVVDAVREQFQVWLKQRRYGLKRQHLDDLDHIATCDRWGGWQQFHHHHLHLRIQPFSPTGPLRDHVRALESEARHIRAGFLAEVHPDWPAALDARLLSYRLDRSIEVNTLALRERPRRIVGVRYRLNGGPWQTADNPRVDFRYVFDLPATLQLKPGSVSVEAEVQLADGTKHIVARPVVLPTQEPRLRIRYEPGRLRGSATRQGRTLTLGVEFPPAIRPLVTHVVYQVHRRNMAPETVRLDAPWFSWPPADRNLDRHRALARGSGFSWKLRAAGDDLVLVEALVYLSGRYAVPLTLFVED